jgi:DNA mismatch repair protein MutS2
MIYPENAAEKLGFLEIKEQLKSKCLSEMGRHMVDKIQPLHQFLQIEKFLKQTHEFKDIMENDSPLPIDHIYPIKKFVEKAKVEGVGLTEEEFFQILLSLKTVFAIIHYFKEREGVYFSLETLFEHLPIEKTIVSHIEAIIDVKGKMKANASVKLLQITGDISKAEGEARKRMDHLYKSAQNQGWTAEGSLTYRDGRLCIPLLAENKRKIKGFVHDESATGQNVFLEPEEVFHHNNLIRDLEFERRREKNRILIELTTKLRPSIPLLLSYHDLLGKLDFIRAKALFAIETESEMPELIKTASSEFINAQHPLLTLSFRKEKKTVVPLNVKIDEHDRIIVVSGPNAGGKSVALKTIALLQIMAQSGLLIPADPNSKVGIYRRFFVDIGDDQSIESDLSTYSAHLTKMRYFLEHADQKTLVLIDEFGTGTDPQFGGPIAEAVLETLNKRKIRGVVTTHYSNLKHFASESPGIENASMLFDNLAMKPLYILQVGKPGSSYAFEIAQKTGLPKEVIQLAKEKVGVQQKKVEYLLVDLEREKKAIYESKREIEKKERQLDRIQEESKTLQTYLEENKNSILKQAKLEAQEILKGANKLIENTISEIKEAQADKGKTKELRKNLQKEMVKNQVEKSIVKGSSTIINQEIETGDWVRLIDSGTVAQVIEVAKVNVILAFGDLRSVVKRARVEKVAKKEVPKSLRKSHSSQLTETLADFNPEIDVRGQRTDDAIYEIEKYLDKAIMLGFPSLKIIHGKGNGILRKMIRENLGKYSQINRMEDEHADRGGDGITYVFFN